jgi:autophagy-related protein 33
MESSYEVLGDSHSEGTSASDEGEEVDVNGEELRSAMEGFRLSQSVRLALAGTGFVMSLVGIWGDGA